MRRVIVESPFGNTDPSVVEENILYARKAVRDCVLNDEAPIASHLLFTQEGILCDEVPEERKLGIEAGLAWRYVADLTAFYTDRNWSKGMLVALHKCIKEMREFELRSIIGPIRYPTAIHEEVERLLVRHTRQPPDLLGR